MPNPDLKAQLERPPLCASAPVLWSLLPLVLGIIAGKVNVLPLSFLLIAATVGTSILTSGLRGAIILTSFLFGLVVQWWSTVHPHPDWENLPKRETRILIQVSELFNARNPKRVSGIGKILQNDIPHDTVTGTMTSFYLEIDNSAESSPERGKLITCSGVITYLPSLDMHDDFQQYLLSRDIFTTINRGKILETNGKIPLFENIRMELFQLYQSRLKGGSLAQDSAGNVLASMLLGDRSLLNNERIDLYRRTGTYHLFAVSGLHVGCVALFLASICRMLGIRAKWLTLPVLLACWYYVWLTGSSPSAVRSGIMISCLMLGRLLLRQPHVFPALVLSAWLVLILYPQQLFNMGFQLSYSVVASIILIGLPTSSVIRSWLYRKIPNSTASHISQRLPLKAAAGFIDICCISISAGMVSAPLIIEHFKLFTPGGVIMGIILNPLASLVIAVGCIAMCAAPFSVVLASCCAKLAFPVIILMEWLLQICVQFPGAYSSREWIIPRGGILLVLLTLGSAWIVHFLKQNSRLTACFYLVMPMLLVACGLVFGTINA